MNPKHPNIVLIVLDTVGARHLSPYGYPRRTAPGLEHIAARSTLYTRAFAPACWTVPTHASLFTGLYPAEHKTYGTNFMLAPNWQHLVSILKNAGYQTLGFSSNGFVSPLNGICRDFNFFADYGAMAPLAMSDRGNPQRREFIRQLSHEKPPSLNKMWFTLFQGVRHGYWDILYFYGLNFLKKLLAGGPPWNASYRYTRRSFNHASRLLRSPEPGKTPFFLFFNFMDGHSLYNPPGQDRVFSRPEDRQTDQTYCLYGEKFAPLREHLIPVWEALYDDAIISLDRAIYKFWQFLEAQNLLDNTVVIITGDHGEHFGEKGHYEHKFSLYNENIWVPMLISYPRSLRSPGTDDRLVSLNDLFSTLLEICESPFPAPRSSVSMLSPSRRASLSSMILGGQARKEALRVQLQESEAWLRGISSCSYALFLDKGLKLLEQDNGQLEIYNLAQDPAETNDLLSTMEPALLQQFTELLRYDQEQTGYTEAKLTQHDQEVSDGQLH
jgi:arylsulfatase A-like enzyme